MMFLLETHQGSNETSESTGQRTALVYWDIHNRHSYLNSWCYWFLEQCLDVLAAFFFFSVGGIVGRWWKDACGFKWRFGGGGPTKFVTIDSQKSFMFFAMGFVVYFIHIISIAEKDFHDVNLNFLVPSYCFSQCRVIQQHLIRSINSRYRVVLDLNNVWFPFGFAVPVNWIHHCWHVSIIDDTNIPFIFPLSDRNVTKGHGNHFTHLKLLSNYLWWVLLSIST